MVYYKNGKVKGFTKKIALPLALAASAFTPVMAETTLKVVGPEGNKIAYDETKEVKLNMTSNDKVSFVEVNIELPAGLQYVEGSFKKADIDELKAHQYKVTLTPKGFHVAIYSDNLVSIVKDEPFDKTIGTFEVKANTKLTGKDNIDLTIVDLTDKDANQIDYNNVGTGNVEGAEGDNSLGSEKVSIDTKAFPGTWKVYTVADLNANNQLEFNPVNATNPKTIQVALLNEIAQISGLEFQIQLPQGLKLNEATLLADADRKEGQNLSFQKLDIDGSDNDYKVFYLGGEKPFKLTDGALLSFDVQADPSLANNDEYTDEILIKNIKLTDIYSNAVTVEDPLVIKVFNPNEKVFREQSAELAEIELLAETEPYTRVYDYPEVLEARKEANKQLEEIYMKGELAYNGNEELVVGLVADYKAKLESDAKANKDLYDAYVQEAKDLQAELDAANGPQYAAGARALAEAEAEVAEPQTYDVKDFIDPALAQAYETAEKAINDFAKTVDSLYNEASAEDPYRFDGALLTDSELDGGQVFTAQQAAEKAITDFIAKRDEINAKNKKAFEDIVNGDLAQRLADAKAYVEQLTADGKAVDNDGPYANYENLEAITDAIAVAEALIEDILSADGSIAQGAEAIALPFEEGIEDVLDDIEDIIDAIDDVIEAADAAKAANDKMTKDITEAFDAVDDALQTVEDNLQGILDDYEFMEEGIFTEGLIDDIQAEIDAIENRIAEIKADVNDKTGYDDEAAEQAEIDAYLEELAGLVDQLQNKVQGDIDAAEAEYLDTHKLGDANMDRVVSTTDYVEIMNYVLVKTEYGEKYANMPSDDSADQKEREKFSQLNVSKEDGDKKINVTDAVALINLLSYGDIHGVAGARADVDAAESIVAETAMVNGVRRIALNLNNALAYAGAQFDVVLPEGVKVTAVKLGSRTMQHSIDSNILADGTLRVVISSLNNSEFAGNSGAIAYIEVEGAGEVGIQNIELATVNAFSKSFNLGEVTGIANVKAAGEGEQVYSLSGRMMNALKKGINIIRRADGSTQKVIKK